MGQSITAPRVVLDANVLISGLISKKGAPGQILDAWRQGLFQVVVSDSIIIEVRRVLRYPHLQKRISVREANLLVMALMQVAQRAPGLLTVEILTRDPTDNMYLACALVQLGINLRQVIELKPNC